MVPVLHKWAITEFLISFALVTKKITYYKLTEFCLKNVTLVSCGVLDEYFKEDQEGKKREKKQKDSNPDTTFIF